MADCYLIMTAFDRSASMGFALNPLNRLSERRHDDAFIATQRADPATQFLLFDEQATLLLALPSSVHDDPAGLMQVGLQAEVRFNAAHLGRLGLSGVALEQTPAIYMGEDVAGVSLFALLLDADAAARLVLTESAIESARSGQPAAEPAARSNATSASEVAPQRAAASVGLHGVDLRAIAARGLVADDMLGILGCAKSVLHWHRGHRFCARCGSATSTVAGGWRRDCRHCGAQHFPRVDPVVIMLAVDGERCLLGRQPRFATGMYSALAGFLEPGETVEDAVRREIQEEAGIACAEVSYFASQPWPFPSSLMLACFARARTTDVVIDVTELEDARWFSRDEVASMLAGAHPAGLSAPQPFAIAHHLLQAFVDGDMSCLGGPAVGASR